jgi:alpha-beta hydrolase superfamily lysophospholipase
MDYHNHNDSIISNNKRLHLDIYESKGAKKVILFLPGMGCYAGIYRGFLFNLASHGFNVVGIDLAGHGRSEGMRGEFTFDEIMQNVSDLISYALASFSHEVGLMGSSLGGTFALYAALNDRRPKAFLCHNVMNIASDLHVPTRIPTLIKLLAGPMRHYARPFHRFPTPLRMIVDWLKVVDDPAILNQLKQDKYMVWNYSLGSWASFLDHTPRIQMKALQNPLKVVVGSNDRIFPPVYCQNLSRRIGPKGASFETVTGGHALPLERAPVLAGVAARWFSDYLAET